jgi:predicted transport protein
MSDIHLFSLPLNSHPPTELISKPVALEKSLQSLIEANLETYLGVRFLNTEHPTDKGRIDTIGIDNSGCPVIIEYKRHSSDTVINQSLFYLRWLMTHKDSFELLVLKKLGQVVSDNIDWSGPRIICIADDFSKWDHDVIEQINHNIELVKYRKYGDEFLLFEFVNTEATLPAAPITTTTASTTPVAAPILPATPSARLTAEEWVKSYSGSIAAIFDATKAYLVSLGADVQVKPVKYYFAFRRNKNFCCVEPRSNSLSLNIGLDPTSIALDPGFTRDITNIGHLGTGNLEITIRSLADLDKAKPILMKAYQSN